MKLIRHPQNPLLSRNPDHAWEAGSVLNPTVWRESPKKLGMLYRATNDINSSEAGHYLSSIGLAWSHDGIAWDRQPEPLISPDQSYESNRGSEDPRITKVGDEYFIFYTGVSQFNSQDVARIALATTTDFKTVKKFGVVGPDRFSKAAALFPGRVNNHNLLLWADQSDKGHSRIILSEFETLVELKHTKPVDWDPERIDRDHLKIPNAGIFTEQEVGAVPIETDAGWLIIYSGFSREPRWTICAALLDKHNPRHIIGASKDPLLIPETANETTGVVNNVCFPEGAVIVGDELYVYYGSGDQGVCLATCNLADLITELKR